MVEEARESNSIKDVRVSKSYKIDKGWLGYYLVLFDGNTDNTSTYEVQGPYDQILLRRAIRNLGWRHHEDEINNAINRTDKFMNMRLGGGWQRVS